MSSSTYPMRLSEQPTSQSRPSNPPRQLRGRYRTIFLSCAALILPFIIISAIILGLVFYYRINPNQEEGGSRSILGLPAVDGSQYIYTNISPTRLARVASLYSSVFSYLTTFAVLLSTYPLALFILKNSLDGDPRRLPTPYQLSLALHFAEGGGGILSILSWFNYTRRSQNANLRKHQAGPTSGPALTAIFTASIGILIFAAEWWLHFAIEPFNLGQATPLDPTGGNYSFTLPPNCLNTDNSYGAQLNTECSISPSIRGGYLINPVTSFEALENISTTVSINIMSDEHAAQYAFLGIPENGKPSHHDFTATTYSALTQCKPVARECDVSRANLVSGVSAPFTCSRYPAFTGDLIAQKFSYTYFTDSSGTNNHTDGSSTSSNPFYFGVNGNTLPAAGNSLPLQNSTEFVSLEFGGLAYLMFCNCTVFDTEYTVVNGSITRFEISPSNSSVATLMVQALVQTVAGVIKLEESANLAGLSKTEQQFGDTFSLTYSQVLLGLVAGVMSPSPAVKLQQHSDIIVSRVPRAPLYTLVTLSFCFVGFGVLLGLVALATAHNEDIEEVRQRLSIQQLVAEKFEGDRAHQAVDSLDECFAELEGQPSERVGVVGSRGKGWELKAL
ncbi:hypothetical protein AA313_de0206819 [Arthrobotrys entomopaga]|nr:hypothetical protein AA313_de0206819 [Arthrobotrys entomopaga]